MERLLQGVKKFQSEVFSQRKKLFKELSKGQKPEVLFITCSDSRIDPNLLTQTEPGELFILRNAGNFVPTYSGFIGGNTATIEYAVAVLKVKHIIVCGHTDCGAMNAILHPERVKDLPAVKNWMQQAEATNRIIRENYNHLSGKALVNATVKENVLVQLDHLRTHPTVAARLRRDDLHIHGWVYSIGQGKVWVYVPELKEFVIPGEK